MRNVSIKDASAIMVAEGIGEEADPITQPTGDTEVKGCWYTLAGSLMECVMHGRRVTVNVYTRAEMG